MKTINKITELNIELSNLLGELSIANLANGKKELSNTLSYFIESMIELSNELDELE